MNHLTKNISTKLKENCPSVKFEISGESELIIEPECQDGFKIVIQEGERENTLYFGNWHFHFDNNKEGNNELLDYLGFGMTKLGRLKTYLRNGIEYKWTFETQNEKDGKWYPAGTMSLMNFKFWDKARNKVSPK